MGTSHELPIYEFNQMFEPSQVWESYFKHLSADRLYRHVIMTFSKLGTRNLILSYRPIYAQITGGILPQYEAFTLSMSVTIMTISIQFDYS